MAEKSISLRMSELDITQLDWISDVLQTDRSKMLRSVIPQGEHGNALASYAQWIGFQGEPGGLFKQIFIDCLLTAMRNHKAFPLDLQLRTFCPTREDAYKSDWVFLIFRKWIGALQGQEGCRIEPIEINGKRQWVALGWFDDDNKFARIKAAMEELGAEIAS